MSFNSTAISNTDLYPKNLDDCSFCLSNSAAFNASFEMPSMDNSLIILSLADCDNVAWNTKRLRPTCLHATNSVEYSVVVLTLPPKILSKIALSLS